MEGRLNNRGEMVIGVLDYNNKTRNELISRGNRYSQYKNVLNPAIGEVYDIDYYREVNSLTNDSSLLDYSHNNDTPLSNFINGTYFSKDREKEVVGFDNISNEKMRSWGGQFLDYRTYVDEVLGADTYSKYVSYVNKVLSKQFIENALREYEVGVVRDINISVAQQGIITTNPNNMTGDDTKLGIISNYMYSMLLHKGAEFNSARASGKKYITPSLINQYGNNRSNEMKLGNMFRVGTNKPMISEDLGKDVKISELKDGVIDVNGKYVNELVKNAVQYLSTNNKDYDGAYGFSSLKNGKIDTEGYIKPENKDFFVADKGVRSYYVHADDVDVDYTDSISNKYNTKPEQDGLLGRTSKLFKQHKINTMIGRFHTTLNKENGITDDKEFIDTAKNKDFGNSRGRNLLTKDAEINRKGVFVNGYENPYCRTWTYHHQYDSYNKTIRPFVEKDETGKDVLLDIQKEYLGKYRTSKIEEKTKINVGADYLTNNSVLDKYNGLVNICPIADDNHEVRIEKCMFSIENLAWKDVLQNNKNIRKEQIGPNGGRIMWFPPYDLSFSENVNVNWEPTTFIGRGEKIHTYRDTDRSGNLSFTMLIDHPSIINTFSKIKDGMLEDGVDVDNEILRFFAGCGMPNIKVKEEEPPVEEVPPIENKVPEIKTLSFNIYFPNNFSGSLSKIDGNDMRLDDCERRYNRLLNIIIGKNCTVYYNNKDEWYGYEMGKTITQTGDTKDYKDEEEFVGVSNKCASYSGTEKYINDVVGLKDWGGVNRGTGKHCYKYPIDGDLRQVLRAQENYSDTSNFSLNRKYDEKYHSGVDVTFAEFIYALIECGKINFDDIIKKDAEITDFIEGKINENIKEFLNSDLRDVKTKSIEEIITKFPIKSCSVTGGADANDNKKSKMLAKRRANTTKNFLENIEELKGKIKIEEPRESKEKNDDNSFENVKKDRYVTVKIEYESSNTSDLCDNNSNATNDDNQEKEKTKKFNTFYDEVLMKPECNYIMKAFESIINSSVANKLNESFEKNNIKKAVEAYCSKENIDISDINKENCDDFVKYFISNIKDFLVYEDGDFSVESSDFLRFNELINHDESYNSYIKSYPPKEVDEENEEKKKELEKELKDVGKEFKEYYKELKKLSDDIKKLESDNTKINKENSELELENQGLELNISEKEKELKEKQKELDYWEASFGDKVSLKNEIKKLESDIKEKKNKIEKNNKKISKNNEDIKENETKINNKKNIVKNTNGKIEEINSKIVRLEGDIEKIGNIDTRYDLDSDRVNIYFYCRKLDSNDKFKKEYEKNEDYIYPLKGGVENGIKLLDVGSYKYYDCKETVNYENLFTLDFNKLIVDHLIMFKIKDCGDEYFDVCKYLDNPEMRTLIYIKYVLSLSVDNKKDDDKEHVITKKDVWKFICKWDEGLKNISYDKVKTSINEVKEAFDKNDEEKIEKLIKEYTPNLLKYCDKVISEVIDNAKKSGLSKYEERLKMVLEKIKSEQEQNLAEKKKELQETLDRLKLEEENNRKRGLLKLFTGEETVSRYEDEGEYFKRLELDSPFIYEKIVDKFKYFNPGFHSISPEGFNARLNFLHQCTRQGNTLDITSGYDKTATNLSFGRMPVCVLRIGDFINTKIIIQNVSINYDMKDGIKWDLNQEGIGVQPMYAKVQLSIIIVGGQSLTGPINRLQNAISFDYYANSGVYDDRADRLNASKNYENLFIADFKK